MPFLWKVSMKALFACFEISFHDVLGWQAAGTQPPFNGRFEVRQWQASDLWKWLSWWQVCDRADLGHRCPCECFNISCPRHSEYCIDRYANSSILVASMLQHALFHFMLLRCRAQLTWSSFWISTVGILERFCSISHAWMSAILDLL